MALPLALAGQDVIGQARTGTGKTFAFGVAMLQRISQDKSSGDSQTTSRAPRGLVVTPTRELALQVAGDIETAGSRIDATVLTVFGGRAYEPQIEGLRAGVDIVVGTPGRLLDLNRQKHLDLSRVSVLVLDEADRMLDLGFLPDVERILTLTPGGRQTMLFSATMPGEIVTLSRRYLDRPTHVRAEAGEENRTVPSTAQHVLRTHPMNKPEVLARILQASGRGRTMIFCRTKRNVDRLTDDLNERGFAAKAVHGDLGQGQREQAMRSFRSGKNDVLVATDVAARGLDVEDVTHVVNYACPDDEKEYLHRIGRTGRAGRAGTAVTFVDWADVARWQTINVTLDLPFPEPEETYSTSKHLYSELDIPADATGRIAGARSRPGRSRQGKDKDQRSKAGARDDNQGQRRPRRTQQRKRTRGGQPVDRSGTTDQPSAAHESAKEGRAPQTGEARAAATADGSSTSEKSSGEGGGARRRRRRGGRGRSKGSTSSG